MKLFAGYDGGGTKTACVLTDETGRMLGSGLGGPSNYLYCGREVAAESVRTATSEAFANAGLPMARLDTAYMASAAILIQHGDAHVPFFSTCIDAEHVICESDIYNIWFGSVRERPAVVTIAGTGAITYICSPEGHLRVGGWGPLLGDEGSGYDLGLRALKLACRMYDGREPEETAFMDAMFRLYDTATPGELLRKLNKGHCSADSFKVAIALQLLGHRKKIQGNVLIGELTHRLEYHTVLFTIETAGGEFIHRLVDAVRLYQESSEDCLFDVKSLRWSVSHLKPKRV